MASDKNLILGAAMAAPKFNTGFVDVVDREVKEFTTGIEKEAKERQAKADAISLDTSKFLEGLPANPQIELLDSSIQSTVESFLAKKRVDLAGLFRQRRGDTVTYAPGTEAYNSITKEIKDGERAINNVLSQLKTHQANKADYIREHNSISNHWKNNNLDMFSDMKNIYLEEAYGNSIDTNGNITINGKYKISDWQSGDNIKKLDWGVTDSGYLEVLSKQFDGSTAVRGQKMEKGDSYDILLGNNLKQYFATQPDGGVNAIKSIVFDNPKILGFDMLQGEDKINELKELVNNNQYKEAIEKVTELSMNRVRAHQNGLYDKANEDTPGLTEKFQASTLEYLKRHDRTRVDLTLTYNDYVKTKDGAITSYVGLQNKLAQYGMIVQPVADANNNIVQLQINNQKNGTMAIIPAGATSNQILSSLDGVFGAFVKGIDYESIPLELRINN